MDRREMLGVLAGALGGGATWPLPPPRLGVQLYTVRRDLERDFGGTLARVAAIGFREVEFAGYFGRSAAEVRDQLARHGLEAPAAHTPAITGDTWRAALDAAGVIGHRYVVLPWVDADQRRTLADYGRLAAALNRAGTEARAAGVQLAYHNQSYEFAPLGGLIPFEVLVAETDPALVHLELDVYWVTRGGQDPVRYLHRWADRIFLLHLKDSAGAPEHRQVDVGSGRIDFRALVALAGPRYLFVEHDEPADPFASIRASYTYLQRLERP